MCIEINHPSIHNPEDTRMSTPFDSLSTTRRLEAAGIATRQAEAIVVAIQESRDTTATKRDVDTNVAALRSDMEAGTAALRSDMEAGTAALRSDMENGMAALRSEMSAMEGNLRAEMGKLRGEIYRALWVQGAGLAGIILASELF